MDEENIKLQKNVDSKWKLYVKLLCWMGKCVCFKTERKEKGWGEFFGERMWPGEMLWHESEMRGNDKRERRNTGGGVPRDV